MKRRILINGAMGAGKSTLCRELLNLLPPCAFLDGDWCWTMNPFVLCDETKKMVMENILSVLSRFLQCPVYENVLFCWVMHEQSILDDLKSRLPLDGVTLHALTLTLSREQLIARLNGDIRRGIRTPDVLDRSLARLPLYQRMDTVKIDGGSLTPRETAELVLAMIQKKA